MRMRINELMKNYDGVFVFGWHWCGGYVMEKSYINSIVISDSSCWFGWVNVWA